MHCAACSELQCGRCRQAVSQQNAEAYRPARSRLGAGSGVLGFQEGVFKKPHAAQVGAGLPSDQRLYHVQPLHQQQCFVPSLQMRRETRYETKDVQVVSH